MVRSGGGGGIVDGDGTGGEVWCTGVVRSGGGGAADPNLTLCFGECWGTGGECDCVGGGGGGWGGGGPPF